MILLSRRHILQILSAWVIALCSLMAVGCADSHEVVEDPGKIEVYNVEFRLKAGNAVPSRATEEYGTPEECYIDLENLKVLIFDENKTLKQVLYDNGEMDDVTSLMLTGLGDYVLRTKLDPADYNLLSKFAVVALANWRSLDGDTKMKSDWNGIVIDKTQIGILTIDDLATMTFQLNPVADVDPQPDSWIPGDGRWIPMFGSRFTSLAGYNTSLFNEGTPMPIPDVNLVRAISKIEITNLDVSDNSPVIESIMLDHRNTVGRLMPDYNFTGATSNVTSTTIPVLPGATTHDIPFHRQGNLYTLYLPEMDLPNAASRQAIRVNLNMDGVKYQRWIYLADYLADGTPNLTGPYNSDWDAVKRNYIYRYTLNLNYNLDQSIGVVVTPYNSVVLGPIFGLDDPESND